MQLAKQHVGHLLGDARRGPAHVRQLKACVARTYSQAYRRAPPMPTRAPTLHSAYSRAASALRRRYPK